MSKFTSLFFLVGLFFIIGCQGNESARSSETESVASAQEVGAVNSLPFDTAAARIFVTTAIEDCFNKNNGKYDAIVTKRYSNLISDGLELFTLQMEGNESESSEFDKYYKKWKEEYQQLDSNFLHADTWVICGQDWNKVRCKETRYLRHDAISAWFSAVITTGLEHTDQPPCKRDFRVVKERDQFKIDYVKHYVENFEE